MTQVEDIILVVVVVTLGFMLMMGALIIMDLVAAAL